MRVSFLTPAGALVGLVGLAALALLAASELRSRRACAALALPPRRRASVAVDAAALVAVAALVSLAAGQPVVSAVGNSRGRTDAEVIVVMDVTRSMLARDGASQPGRLERARPLAIDLRARLPDVRVGVASLTDRLLPHLFPSLSANAFAATLQRAIDIERPPPDRRTRGRATAFGALADVARLNFFSQGVSRRVAVAFTDGETLPVGLGPLREHFVRGRTKLVFVHTWHPDERVYAPGGAVERYRPDPGSRLALERVATAVDGFVFDESQLDDAVAAVRRLLGDGPVEAQGRELTAVRLGPLAVAAAFAPLLLLVLRRNL